MIRDLAALLSALLWPAVITYFVWRLGRVADRMVDVTKPAVPEPEPIIPEDLMAYALSYTEKWAQDDVHRAIRESYEKWRDWNRVRAAMGIGRIG